MIFSYRFGKEAGFSSESTVSDIYIAQIKIFVQSINLRKEEAEVKSTFSTQVKHISRSFGVQNQYLITMRTLSLWRRS